MNLHWTLALSLSLSLLFCSPADGSQDQQEPTTITPVVLAVLNAPTVVRGSDDVDHLVYELQLRNVVSASAVVERVEVRDAASSGRVLLALSGEDITARLQLGARGTASGTLAPFQLGTLFVHIAIGKGEPVPDEIQHRVDVSAADLPPRLKRTTSVGGRITVGRGPVPVLGPPLRGGPYIAADGCCDSVRHVRALLPLAGELHLAQRYAVDWEQLDHRNRIFVGDSRNPRSYHIYGNEVLAVADATVVRVVDGMREATPGALPEGLPVQEADGNHVILTLKNGIYVLYAHLQPGSIKVAEGQQVRRGDVLGLVGNSGNSSAPHLHLHVMDRPSGLVANGLPYVFDSYEIVGIDKAGTADFDRAEQTGVPATITTTEPPAKQRETLPMDLSVVRWPE